MRLVSVAACVALVVGCASEGGDAPPGDTDDASSSSEGSQETNSAPSSSPSSSGTTMPSTSNGPGPSTDPSQGSSGGSESSDDTGDNPLSPGCGQPMAEDWFAPYTASWGGEGHRATVDGGGVEREYLIEFPENYDPDTPYPLVFSLHGQNGTMDNAFGQQLASEWDHQAIVVYPQGLGAVPTWSFANSGQDIDMFDAIVEQVGNGMCVDRTRIFTWGFSMGGFFANVLACVRGDVIAGSSPCAGGMPFSSLDCVGPVPQYIVHGDADTVVGVNEGRAARDIWLSINGCTEDNVPDEHEHCVRYDNCESGAPVVYCEIPGAGHALHQDLPGIEAAGTVFLRDL